MSPETKLLLKEIRQRPEWKELLELILDSKVPFYRRSRSADQGSVIEQSANWIFESGRAKERERIVKLLTGESNGSDRD